MTTQRGWVIVFALQLALIAADACAVSAQGTAFTYQGQLSASGVPAAGQTYQFTFTLYDAASNGNVVGTPIPQSILVGPGGLFTTDLDFGQTFNGTQYWLEIKVGTTLVNEEALAARQPINVAPVAQYALNTPSETFAEFYHTYTGFPVFVSPADPIPFLHAAPSSGSSILGLIGPPDFMFNRFLVTISGIYEVSFEISTQDAGGDALAFTVNGVVVPYAQIKTQSGKFLIQMNAGDNLSLINNQPDVFLLGNDVAGSTDANLVIKLLHTQ